MDCFKLGIAKPYHIMHDFFIDSDGLIVLVKDLCTASRTCTDIGKIAHMKELLRLLFEHINCLIKKEPVGRDLFQCTKLQYLFIGNRVAFLHGRKGCLWNSQCIGNIFVKYLATDLRFGNNIFKLFNNLCHIEHCKLLFLINISNNTNIFLKV